jgi:hypothetical protein
MKKVTLLLILSVLFQSCYSYREIDVNQNLIEGKKYKIKQFNKYEKVRFVSSSDSSITIIDNKKLEQTIFKKDIITIKKRHFSVTKTILLPVGVGIGIIGIGATIAFGNVRI